MTSFVFGKKFPLKKSDKCEITIAHSDMLGSTTLGKDKKIIQEKDFKNKILKLSYGKKKHFLVKIT